MTNNSYTLLSGIGSKNCENKLEFSTAEQDTLGVNIYRTGAGHKPINMTLLVPTSRSETDSRRVLELKMTGNQARMLYNALSEFYSTPGY